MKKKWIVAAAVYTGLLAVCLVALYAVPSVRGMLERTYIAEYGTIDVSDEVSVFIVRDETVYTAAQASEINRLAEEYELVRAKSRVTELTPVESEIEKDAEADARARGEALQNGTTKGRAGKDIKAEDDTGRYEGIMNELGDSAKSTKGGKTKKAGYVSYHIDGAEAALSTDALDDLSHDDLRELTGKRVLEMPDKKCGRGYPIFKIIRNGKWYLIFFLDNEEAVKYEPGAHASMDIDGNAVDVTISQVTAGDKESRVVLSCKSFFDGFLGTRTLDAKITVASADGLVLEDSSIVEAADGRRGVFVMNKLGEHVFKPVSVKADDGGKCVVYSDLYVDSEGQFVETIENYDEVIANPTSEDLASIGIEEQEEKTQESEENGDQG